MNYYKTIFALICLLTFYKSDAQINGQSYNIDSLQKVLLTQKADTSRINTLNALSNRLNQVSDFTSAMRIAKEALLLSKKLKSKKAEGDAYLNIAGAYQKRNNSSDNKKNNFRGNDETIDIPGIPQSLEFIDSNFEPQNNYSEVLKNLNASLRAREESGDKKGMAQAYNSIGEIYSRQGKYNEALEKHSAALKIFEQPGMPDWGPPGSYMSIAGNYINEGDILSAKGDKSNAFNHYTEALKNAFLSLKGWENAGKKDAVAQSYLTLGNINIKLDKPLEARQYLQKSVEISKQLHDKNSLSSAYNNLSFLDNKQGNYKEAYEYYKLYILYRDSVDNVEISRKFSQAQLKHDYEVKEANAKTALAKKDAEITRARNIQYLIIVSLGVIILAISIIVFIQHRNNRQKQKANLSLQLQKEKVESTLSALKATQAQLLQSEKMASLGELTAGIAHEIQNPLNFVNNFSEVNKELLLEMKEEINNGNMEEVKTIANDVIDNQEKINHHGKRADAIVKGMLQHSRTSAGQKELTGINALTDEYLRLSYHGLRAKDKTFNATIKTDFDERIEKINIVPQDIGRVLLNLYNNAFYAVAEKKKNPHTLPIASGQVAEELEYEPIVSVSTKLLNSPPAGGDGGKSDNYRIEISVKDNGNGIPQKVLDKIFQPFFTTKPTGEGTGLGLSLSYDIIKAHGGQLKVVTKEASDEPHLNGAVRGSGSEFIIQLPIV